MLSEHSGDVKVLAGGTVANAIYNAIGVRIKDLPINPEKIFNAIKKSQNNF